VSAKSLQRSAAFFRLPPEISAGKADPIGQSRSERKEAKEAEKKRHKFIIIIIVSITVIIIIIFIPIPNRDAQWRRMDEGGEVALLLLFLLSEQKLESFYSGD